MTAGSSVGQEVVVVDISGAAIGIDLQIYVRFDVGLVETADIWLDDSAAGSSRQAAVGGVVRVVVVVVVPGITTTTGASGAGVHGSECGKPPSPSLLLSRVSSLSTVDGSHGHVTGQGL